MYSLILSLSILLFCAGNIHADFIQLINGQTATTQILDTSGCEVQILRGNNPVSINKKLVAFIVISKDTINYANYQCSPLKTPQAPLNPLNLIKNDIQKLETAISSQAPTEKDLIKEKIKSTFGVSLILAGVTSEIFSIRGYAKSKKTSVNGANSKETISDLRCSFFSISLLSAAAIIGGCVTIAF
jgi:hypothetical protein